MKSFGVKDSKKLASSAALDFERSESVKAKQRSSTSKKIGTGSNRKCKICGKDPHPNYFFCPACHHRVDAYEENDER